MKKFSVIISAILLVCVLGLSALAHSGRTDSDGGHNENINGGYHYHHGYSAHQHPNGVCPYDYNDNTITNNHSSKTKLHLYDVWDVLKLLGASIMFAFIPTSFIGLFTIQWRYGWLITLLTQIILSILIFMWLIQS